METEVRRTEINAPGAHTVREERTTTATTNTNTTNTLPNIVGAGVKNRSYARDHVVTKQQMTYMAPIALAVILALTLLYLRSHEMFPWHHTPTMQEKLTNQYTDLSGKATQSAKDAAKMAQETWAGAKAAGLAKDSAEWLAKQGIKEKLGEYAETVQDNLGGYTETVKDTLHLGKDKAAERAREAADRSYVARAKEWVGDKVNEATGNIGNKVGSVTEDIKHRVEELREDARHAAEVAKEEARHAASQKGYEAGSSYNDAKVKAHETKRSLKDAAAAKLAEHL
jgi:gas vesicle protein